MAHIHAQIDFVVSAFIVRKDRVLLIHHKKLDAWLAVGGHVELHETTDEAMDREIKEETRLIAGKNLWYHQENKYNNRRAKWGCIMDTNIHGSKLLRNPWGVEIHDFPPVQGHRHLALVYLAHADTFNVTLEKEAHNHIGWFEHAHLDNARFNVPSTIRAYGHEALEVLKHKQD